MIDEHGRPANALADRVKRATAPRVRGDRSLGGERLAASLLHGNWMYFPSAVFRRDVAARYGFRPGYDIVLDLDLYLRILLDGGTAVLVERPGIAYRRHAASLSSTGAGDGSRFAEEISYFAEMSATMTAAGWPRAARAARWHWTSRLHAVAKAAALLRAGDRPAAATMLRGAVGPVPKPRRRTHRRQCRGPGRGPLNMTTTPSTLDDEERSTEQLAVELSVVLPCLNEAETLATCIRKAPRLAATGSACAARSWSPTTAPPTARRRSPGRPAPGWSTCPAAATAPRCMAGIEAARGEYVMMADADDSYALEDLGAFLDELRAGADLVMGNRFRGGIEPGAMPFLHKYLGNPVLSLLGRLFFRIPVRRLPLRHAGIPPGPDARSWACAPSGMEFASEMVVRASLAHLRISEVPTTLRPDGRSRPPHLRTWRDGWRHLRFLLAFSPRWLLLYPALSCS